MHGLLIVDKLSCAGLIWEKSVTVIAEAAGISDGASFDFFCHYIRCLHHRLEYDAYLQSRLTTAYEVL